ncbi:hypothetical protein CANMA_001309 [Candida margitis]|uniref:uncharacterized protein n=1 Tax=Candida margitis TaxID=1775924 RepID=UPI002227EA50|nr:uncharacterized protein CANMA_001309 [Candida margitis]KAI5969646.1 hypothetical protein CANMA_001309 [Candida margitis]
MVVRSLIYGVIDRVPVVNNISRFIQDRSQVSDVSSTSSESNSDIESDDATEDEYLQEVVLPQSPKQKIHAKILKNRTTSPTPATTTGSQDCEQEESNILFDSPTKTKVSAIDRSHIKPVSARLSKRKIETAEKIEIPDLDALTSPTLVNDSDQVSTPKQYQFASMEERQTGSAKQGNKYHVEQYMNDQNSKFNELITNNIGAVLNEDKDDERDDESANIVFNYNKDLNPGVALLSMVYDNRKAIASSVYKYGKQQVRSRLPYIPFINPTTQVSQDETSEYLIGNEKESLSSPFASPILGKALMKLDNSRAVTTTVEQDESINVDLSEQDLIDQRNFDQLMTNLDDEVKIDIFLDSLDEKTKINLLHSLRKDLNMYNTQHEDALSPQSAVRNLYYNENISTIDKVQIFIIISVKLFITGVKLFIPITKYLIYKFQQNQMFIFNAKNMNKFFNFMVKFMNYLDLKLNDNEELIDQLSRQDYLKTEENIEEMYNEFTSRTKSYFKPSYFKDRFIAKDDFVKRGMYDLVLGNALGDDDNDESRRGRMVKRYEDDPNYAMYFTGKSIDSSARESETGSFIDEEEEESDVYTTAPSQMNLSKRSNSFSDGSSSSRRSTFSRRRKYVKF